jgi:hypothetical protein
VDDRLQIRNCDPVYRGFAGPFIRNTAPMACTATVGETMVVSAPLPTSSRGCAEIGLERHGIFFPA